MTLNHLSRVNFLPVVFDIETEGLDPFKNKVLAIAWKVGHENPIAMCVKKENAAGEKQLLDLFFSKLNSLSEVGSEEGIRPLLVGYNILGFDIPFLTTRAIVNGMIEESATLRKFYRVDLMHLVTRYLRTNNKHMKLKEVAEALGIGVVDEVEGADVPELFEEENYKAIMEHCISDVKLAYQLMLKLKPLIEYNVQRRYNLGFVELICDRGVSSDRV